MPSLALLSLHFGGAGMVGGLAHMVIASVIHGLIFSVIFRLISHLSLSEAVVLVVVVIGGMFLYARSRDRRRW